MKTAALLLAAGAAAASNVTVDTTYGPVIGDRGLHVEKWGSVPFAAPPVGDLRFRAPQAPAPWTEPLDARARSEMCAQGAGVGLSATEGGKGAITGSEDCLYLDVVRPRNTKAGDDLPVMVWVHGGGWVSGDKDGMADEYDSSNFVAEEGVIVVAMNYRLAPLGFLALEELAAEDAANSTGNVGIRDQRFALQWVQDNIEAFGGDPDAVTLWGESAGGFSVCAHLANGQQPGLFRAAIMESGTCSSHDFFPSREDATAFGAVYADAMGCSGEDVVECLRALDVADLWPSKAAGRHDSWPYEEGHAAVPTASLPTLAPVLPWGAVVDGSAEGLPDFPLSLMQRGEANMVPLLTGYNENEGSAFLADMPFVVPGGVDLPLDEAALRAAAAHLLHTDDVDGVVALYNNVTQPNWSSAMAMLMRDYVFVCPTRAAATAMTDNGVPSYLYRFNYSADWLDMKILGDYHGSETYLVFDNPTPLLLHHFDADDKTMAKTFGDYWAAFAQSKSPGETWPSYASPALESLVMDLPVTTERNAETYGNCEFWAQYSS